MGLFSMPLIYKSSPLNTPQLAVGMKAVVCRRQTIWYYSLKWFQQNVPDILFTICGTWFPKYRKFVLKGEIGDTLEKILEGIAKRYDIEIDTLEVMPDHVHLFGSAPPKYSPSKVVQIMKSISARKLFERHPEIREKLWGGALWVDGFFVHSVGDNVTKQVIRRYIKSQHEDHLRFDL